jgi:hypothetical protein
MYNTLCKYPVNRRRSLLSDSEDDFIVHDTPTLSQYLEITLSNKCDRGLLVTFLARILPKYYVDLCHHIPEP